MKCHKCGSVKVEVIGHYSQFIALDDMVDVVQMMCNTCGNEWEY